MTLVAALTPGLAQRHHRSSWVHVGLPDEGDEPRGELWSIGSQGRHVQGLAARC